MGLNQSSPVQSHVQDQQHHWNKLDEEHYQTYIKNELHGDSQGKPIILGIYNRWLMHHDQKPLSPHDFESMVNDLSTRAAKYAMTAKKAADSKAKTENQKAIKTFENDEGNLEERAIVYFHGKGDSLKMHYYVPDTMDYIHGEFQKWTKFRLVDFYPFEATRAHGEPDAELLCFVELQKTKHDRQNILLTWAEFINNFTPFNEEDSKPNTHGSFFKPINWIFDPKSIRARTHYTPTKSRDSRQSRQSSLDQERYSQYGGDSG